MPANAPRLDWVGEEGPERLSLELWGLLLRVLGPWLGRNLTWFRRFLVSLDTFIGYHFEHCSFLFAFFDDCGIFPPPMANRFPGVLLFKIPWLSLRDLGNKITIQSLIEVAANRCPKLLNFSSAPAIDFLRLGMSINSFLGS